MGTPLFYESFIVHVAVYYSVPSGQTRDTAFADRGMLDVMSVIDAMSVILALVTALILSQLLIAVMAIIADAVPTLSLSRSHLKIQTDRKQAEAPAQGRST